MSKCSIYLDSNVILKVTHAPGSREDMAAHELFRSLKAGLTYAVVLSPIVTEVYYKVFEATGKEQRAQDVIDGLYCTKGINCVAVTDVVALRAGQLMSKYNYEWRGSRTLPKTPDGLPIFS